MKNYLIKHYGVLLIIIAFVGIIIKNLALVSNMLSTNHFDPNIIFGLSIVGGRVFLEMAVIMLLFSPTFLFKGRLKYLYPICIDILFTILCFVDVCYGRFFIGAPSLFWITLPKNTGNDSGFDITQYVSLWDFVYVFDFLILIPMFIVGIKKKFFSLGRRPKLSGILALASVMVLVIPSVLPSRGKTYNYRTSVNMVENFTSIGYHMVDLFTFGGVSNGKKLSTSELEQIDDYYETKNENLPNNEYKGAAKDDNLIIIQVESMEAFVINASINGEAITPNINQMLNDSYYFSGIREQVMSGNSSDCDLMVMTGTLPVSYGITYTHFPNTEYYGLAEMLRNKNDAYSMYFNAADTSTWNYKAVLTSTLGFDEMNFNIPSTEKVGAYISDKAVFDYAFSKIESLSGPFYSHIVLCSSHLPFDVPTSKQCLNLPKGLGIMGDYLQAIHYVDACIGEFIAELDAKGILDDTTVVIYGDHGGIHKYCAQKVDKLENKYPWMGSSHNYTIPLIIHNKSLETKEFSVIGGQIDILPTLLYLLNVDPVNDLIGRVLVNTNREYAFLANGKLVGKLTAEERKKLSKAYLISDLIIRSNYYFKQNKKIN